MFEQRVFYGYPYKVNTIDNAAPTVIFDKNLASTSNRFLNTNTYIGDSILSGSVYKYHEIALGTRIYDILGLQATTNNLLQSTITSGGSAVTGPIFEVTENSEDALKLKIYLNKLI